MPVMSKMKINTFQLNMGWAHISLASCHDEMYTHGTCTCMYTHEVQFLCFYATCYWEFFEQQLQGTSNVLINMINRHAFSSVIWDIGNIYPSQTMQNTYVDKE